MTKSISLFALFVVAVVFSACGGGSSGRTAGDGAVGAGDGAVALTCGGPGLPCCAGNTCSGGGCCLLNVCAAPGAQCGSLGGTCSKGSCGNCGGAGQPCCGAGLGLCTAGGTKCQSSICMACGSAGLPCCEGNACLGTGLACNGSVCAAGLMSDASVDAAGGAGGMSGTDRADVGILDGPVVGAGGSTTIAPTAGAGATGTSSGVAGAGGTATISPSAGAGGTATISPSAGAGGTATILPSAGALGGAGGVTGAGGVGGSVVSSGGSQKDGGAGTTAVDRDAAIDAPITSSDAGDAALANCPAGCGPGQACIGGVCTGAVCSPNTKFCQGSQVYTCSAGGDSSVLSATCTSGQYCDMGTATCKTGLCAPNQPACNGKLATTCNTDGTGFLAGGIDCTALDLRCNVNLGTCQPIICSAGASYCEAGAVRKCGSDGTTSTLTKTCLPSEFCADALCNPQVCTPSAPLCDGTIATTCNANGSGFAPNGTNCAANDSVCVAGACKKRICSPRSMFCDTAHNAIVRCTEDGLATTLNQGCEYSQYCDSSTVECTDLECIPNQPACNLTVATTCNALGSGYVAGGENCLAKGLNCRLGACVAETCKASSYFCDMANNAVFLCPMGEPAMTSLIERCDPSYQFCDPVKAMCTTMLCKPGEPACRDDVLSTCKADGSGAGPGGTDCAANGQMCIAGACVSQSIESVGQLYASGETYGTNVMALNSYEITKSRTLVAIEQAMSVTARTITFLVFDCGIGPAVAETGTPATTCTAIESLVSDVAASSPYVLSGTMSVPLVAGRTYMIGAWWSSKATYYTDSHSTGSSLTTSFATLEGGGSVTATTAPSSASYVKRATFRFPQKLHIAP